MHAHQPVDQQGAALGRGLDDDAVGARPFLRQPGTAQEITRVDGAQEIAAPGTEQHVVDCVHRLFPRLDAVDHEAGRQREHFAVDAEDQGLDQRCGHRQVNDEDRPLPGGAAHIDAAAQALHHVGHHLQSHAPAGQGGNLCRRGEVGLEDQAPQLAFRHALGMQPESAGLGGNRGHVQAPAVVGHHDARASVQQACAEKDLGARRLA